MRRLAECRLAECADRVFEYELVGCEQTLIRRQLLETWYSNGLSFLCLIASKSVKLDLCRHHQLQSTWCRRIGESFGAAIEPECRPEVASLVAIIFLMPGSSGRVRS